MTCPKCNASGLSIARLISESKWDAKCKRCGTIWRVTTDGVEIHPDYVGRTRYK